MDTETLTVLQKGEDFEIIVEHDQSGSAYGVTLSKNAYEKLRQHFAVGQGEQLSCQFCGAEDGKHGWTDDGEVCPLDITA